MKTPNEPLNRRQLLKSVGALSAMAALDPVRAVAAKSDSLPTQFYKSLSDEQIEKIVLPTKHPKRQYISNWWYIHREHRINEETYTKEQLEMIQTIFDSLHNPEFHDKVNDQVESDLMGDLGNIPAVGFFGTPDDDDFEFIYTGHHVTRRCNAHTDKGQGFGNAPIFYGNFSEGFHESKDHVGNPYWYQGLLFNDFVKTLDGKQQETALISGGQPRSERGDGPNKMRNGSWPGLPCSELSSDQKEVMLGTIRKMLVMFREDDVNATMKTIENDVTIDDLYVSYYDGKFDIGNDRVWDTWQIEGPEMVWYFRGVPHIHTYFHIKNKA